MKKRFRLGLGALVVLVGVLSLILASSASAFHRKNPSRNIDGNGDPAAQIALDSPGGNYHGFDPMETSVPYVAWRGEEVRLVKCFDPEYFEPRENGQANEGGIPGVAIEADETGEWQIMDWSGDPHVWPKFFDDNDQQTRVFFPGDNDDLDSSDQGENDRGCFAIDITSHKPGIAVVKLKIDDSGEGDGVGQDLLGEGDPTAAHQFNVIWMSFQDVRLRCLEADTAVDPSGCPGAGPITENPNDTQRLGAVVQGRIPLNEEFTSELNADLARQGLATFTPNAAGESAAIFPEDYPLLARTSLAHISWPLAKANNGREGDDNFRNPTCDDSPDTGSLNFPITGACRFDVGDKEDLPTIEYVREPLHTAGDFWDIHDSTGPYNTSSPSTPSVYGADKPRIAEFCGGPEDRTPVASEEGDTEEFPVTRHHAACHVGQFDEPNGDFFPAGYDALTTGGIEACAEMDPDLGTQPNDTVDNCETGEWEAFSRVFHDVSGEDEEPTIGPYSPTRPDETMLSDSFVNAHDAPMPAALVVASIAPNSGAADDISGVGSLAADVDKHEVYNRGGPGCTPDTDDIHCVTGPFSGAYIPPSPIMENDPAEDVPNEIEGFPGNPQPTEFLDDDRDVASGIHGTIANNFNGYLPVFYPRRPLNRGLYHYWDLVDVLREAEPAELPDACVDQGFSTPVGDQEIVLYTDEHGEVQFSFDAGEGFFEGGFTVDPQQLACTAEGLVGTADISVNARYPFQPTTSSGAFSNVLTKNIESLFEKGIVCVPKTADPQASLCVVFARDLDGDPITEEEVCVGIGLRGTGSDVSMVQVLTQFGNTATFRGDRSACGRLTADLSDLPESITDLFPAGTVPPGFPGAGGPCGPSGDLDGFGFLIVKVDGNGSLKATAKFEDEHLERSCFFSIGPAGTTGLGQSGGNNGGGGISPNATLPGGKALADGIAVGRANGSSARVAGGNAPSGKSKPAVQKRASVVFVRIVKPLKLGALTRYIVLRVKSPQKSARIQIKLIGKRGKVMGTMLRKVKTNRTVTVPNLRLPNAVVNVRVKLVA